MRLDTNINNHEKSQALVGRFRDSMLVQAGQRRDPFDQSHVDPTLCTSIPVCVQNRQQLSREVDRQLLRLQDESLDHMQLRLLNDQVNKLIRQLDLWNYRIKQLGGRKELKALYEQGTETLQRRGFHYFGRAKELPEALEKATQVAKKKEQEAALAKEELLLSRVDDFYFGHEELNEEGQAELEEVENFLKSEKGPFEFCGARRLDYNVNYPEVMLPDYDIPTLQEAEQAMIQFRKERIIKILQEQKEQQQQQKTV